MARKKLSEEELEKRQEMLKNEPITKRTKRVLNPRINRLRKNIQDLTKAVKSPRYYFSEEQAENLVKALSDDISELQSAITGATDKELEDIL